MTEQKLAIINRSVFTHLSEFKCRWNIEAEGEVIESGEWEFDNSEAANVIEMSIPTAISSTPQQDLYLNLFWQNNNPAEWCPSEHIVAWDQITLQKPNTQVKLPKVQTLKEVVAGHMQFKTSYFYTHIIIKGSITYKGMELLHNSQKVVSGDRPQTTMGLNRDGCQKFQEFVESGFRKGLTVRYKRDFTYTET